MRCSPSGVAMGVSGEAHTPWLGFGHVVESNCQRQNWPSQVTFRPHVLVRQAVPFGRAHGVPSLGTLDGHEGRSDGAALQPQSSWPWLCSCWAHSGVIADPMEWSHTVHAHVAPVENAQVTVLSAHVPVGAEAGHAAGGDVQKDGAGVRVHVPPATK
jgi:hypothetical protein